MNHSIREGLDRPARWLGLAASPVFALMAWITAGNTVHPAICSMGASPLHGMPWMYALMAVFHLGPWLRLVTHRRRNP
jgi:hypothetical protein